MERNLFQEAEERLGRSLTVGERFIALAENDRVLEDGKAALHAAIEKEKRRCIKRWLRGEPSDLRVTQEMVNILVRLRLAGMDAAEDEIARAERSMADASLVRLMAGNPLDSQNRWKAVRHAGNVGARVAGQDLWDVWDVALGKVIMGPVGLTEAVGYVQDLIDQAARDAAVAAASRRYTVLKGKLAADRRRNAWRVWDHEGAKVIVEVPYTPDAKAKAERIAKLLNDHPDISVEENDLGVVKVWLQRTGGARQKLDAFVPADGNAAADAILNAIAKRPASVPAASQGRIATMLDRFTVTHSAGGWQILDDLGNPWEGGFGEGDRGYKAAMKRLSDLRRSPQEPTPVRWVVEKWPDGDWWALPDGKIGQAIKAENQTQAVKLARLKNKEQGLTGGIGVHIIPSDPLRTAISVASPGGAAAPSGMKVAYDTDRGYRIVRVVGGQTARSAGATEVIEEGFGHSLTAHDRALERLQELRGGAGATKSLTREIEQRFPGWVWQENDMMFVPKKEPLRTVYRLIYGPDAFGDVAADAARLIDTGVDPDRVHEAIWAHDFGLDSKGSGKVMGTNLVARPGASAEIAAMERAGVKAPYVVDWDEGLQRYVVRDSLGHPAMITNPGMNGPRRWDERERAEAWIAKQMRLEEASVVSPGMVRDVAGRPERGWQGTPWDWRLRGTGDDGVWEVVDLDGNVVKRFVPTRVSGGPDESAYWNADDWLGRVRNGSIDPPLKLPPQPHLHGAGIGVPKFDMGPGQPFIPGTTTIDEARAALIAQGKLMGGVPMNPAQMLLYDPQLQPLMEAFKLQLRGITKRIDREGNAQLEIGQDAAFDVLARALDRKVPGALDAAGRMVSGPFNAGLGDVFKRKGGLFRKWQYSAVMDKATCEVCAYFDGTIYYSWRSIAELPTSPLPGGGPNPGCFGTNRCRCRPVPYFGEGKVGDVEPTGTIDDGVPSTPEEELLSTTSPDSITGVQRLGGGVSDTMHGYLPNGTHVKLVPFDATRHIYDEIPTHSDGNNENAGWQIAKRYFRGGDVHVNVPAHVVANIPAYGPTDVSMMVKGYMEDDQHPSDDEIPGWALFDSITGQHDHHANNASLASGPGGDGKLWLVDNGLSFPSYNSDSYYGHTRPWDAYQRLRGDYDLTPEMTDVLTRMVGDRPSLDAELSRYLQSDQLDAMWERIDTMLHTGRLVDGNGGEFY